MKEESQIANFYAGQHILITGATGFMGKILVEKLLRSCPEVGGIYLLIRPKRGKPSNQRMEEYLNLPVFENLKSQENFEKLVHKLHVLNGDVSYPNLNLNPQDTTIALDTITMVFHMAANVKFDQPLKPAVLLNTGGTKNVLDFACNIKKLIVFVHVSTSYCHCEETRLEERMYSAPHSPRKILELVNWMDNNLITSITPKLIGNAPNTYAYTKCLTEELLKEYESKLPIALARPSIVVASLKEPMPGWIDNLNGPTGILVGAGKGVIRTMHCNEDYDADIVPVDISINSLLVIAWKRANIIKNEIEVFHIVANHDNPISWGKTLEIGRKFVYEYPFSTCLWYPGGSPKANYLLHLIALFFFHTIPAYFVDFLLMITRNKPFLVRIQNRISNGLKVLQYYTTRKWFFHNEKLTNIYENLNEFDKKTFYMNVKIDYDSYILNYILGAREYCVKEKLDTLPHARKVLKRLYYLDRITSILLWLFTFWAFFKFSSYILTSSDNY